MAARPLTLDAAIRVERGSFTLDVELSVEAGTTIAVLGPNGAGKTTLLNALAGLVAVAGVVRLGGEVLDDSAHDVWRRPEERPVGVVFQDYLLFPHLSALDNVAFPLRSRGVPRRTARRQAAGWLDRVGLTERATARPAQLSGGQAQRVALARALIAEPRLLLLDEPLAALDVATRSEVRRDLRRILATFPGVRVVVTHDPLEAAALAERLIVIERGRIVQTGTAAELAAAPRSAYVAELAGTNLFTGTAHGDRVDLDRGSSLAIAAHLDGPVFVLVQPRAVALSRHRPEGSPRNVWPATIETVETVGDRCRVRLDGPIVIVSEITIRAAEDLALAEGTAVWVSVKATELDVYPA